MKAAVDAAHQAGKRIAIHSYGPAGARATVRAGADSIEHATYMDDETIAEMARRKTLYVPTIDHNRYYAEHRNQYIAPGLWPIDPPPQLTFHGTGDGQRFERGTGLE